jgi:hypothetical protein
MLAALAVPTAGSDDLLKNLGTNAYPVITIIASYIFSLGVIAPGIPVWYAFLIYSFIFCEIEHLQISGKVELVDKFNN